MTLGNCKGCGAFAGAWLRDDGLCAFCADERQTDPVYFDDVVHPLWWED